MPNTLTWSYVWPRLLILVAAEREGEVRPGDAEVRAWALMGLAVILGERFAIWETDADLDHVVDQVFDMLERGLKP